MCCKGGRKGVGWQREREEEGGGGGGRERGVEVLRECEQLGIKWCSIARNLSQIFHTNQWDAIRNLSQIWHLQEVVCNMDQSMEPNQWV